MLAYPIATAALLIGTASIAASSANPQHKTDFMRAMDTRKKSRSRRRLSQKDFLAELHGDSKKSAAMRKKMIQKSTVTKAPGSGGDRKLQNYNQNYNANNQNSANNGETTYKYSANQDGSDDYFMAYGEWDNTFGFDPTQFSLSYHRCAAVRQFDDEIAAEEDTDSVFATKRFAVFRFCPQATCMGFQEEDADCGCENQCEAIKEAEGDDDDGDSEDEDLCEEACQEQCEIWQQQYTLEAESQNAATEEAAASAYQQAEGGNRKLQNYNNYNNGYNNGYNNDNGNNGDYNAYRAYTFNPNYVAENEDQEIWGARGEGCQNNYGEYMIEMADYLEMMLEWQEERFETYCEYCEECMMNVYESWMQSCMNGGCYRRDLKFEEWKGSEDHVKFDKDRKEQRKLGGYNNFYNDCPEYDTCVEYQNTCGGGANDEFSDYFECTEVESSSGQVAYVGPHCAADGFEITLGVYADEYCNEYIGDGVGIANFIGEELEEDALMQYYNSAYGPTLSQLKYVQEDNVCIPCRKGSLMWDEDNEYSEDDDEIDYDQTEVNEICENLYQVSARCDKHYRAYNNKSKQAKYAEAVAQEDLTCDFIDSIVMGNYDESGIINLSNNGGNTRSGWMAQSDNMYAQQYSAMASEVTPLQIFGLIASILAVGILAVWSMTLHKSLTKQGPWRPRRGLQRPVSPSNANDIDRQNSGIVMGRSASNTSYYMS